MKDKIISINKVFKIYKEKYIDLVALNDLNLEVFQEEILSIMGPSGSGKSTLLNQIGGIDFPTSGQIVSCGKDLSQLNDNELSDYRKFDVGYLFQDFNLSPVLTALDNVILPMKIAGVLNREEMKKSAIELLDEVGLRNRINHKPNQLSGGEKQRIGLLVAIANSPQVLLADEPTGELDSVNSNEVLEIMKKLQQEKGFTIIIVTHNNLVSKIANRLLQLKDGKVVGNFILDIDTSGIEQPNIEIDSKTALKNLFPPKKCISCNSTSLNVKNGKYNPRIQAKTSSGYVNMSLGFAICNNCNEINWGYITEE